MDYNSAEGIREYLTGLAGLRQLAKDRHEAGYQRREILTEFVVLGRFSLDSCGNFSLARFEDRSGSDLKSFVDNLPQAIDRDALFERLSYFGKDCSMVSSLYRTSRIPEDQDVCDECGEGWTIQNAYDVAPSTGEGIRHEACHRFRAERDRIEWYRGVAVDSGLNRVILIPVPNEYWEGGLSWCQLRSVRGALLVGWRKRVIEIDWNGLVSKAPLGDPRLDLTAQSLFPNEDVTKGPYLIHAWGREKLVEYLKVIAKAFRLGD